MTMARSFKKLQFWNKKEKQSRTWPIKKYRGNAIWFKAIKVLLKFGGFKDVRSNQLNSN